MKKNSIIGAGLITLAATFALTGCNKSHRKKNKHSSYGNPRRRIENRICGNRHIDVAIQFL